MIAKTIFRLTYIGFIILGIQLSTLPASAQSTCNPALAAVIPGGSTQTIESGGMTRSYKVYIPEIYDIAQPAPLVLSLQGFTSNSEQQELYTGWDAIADSENFIVVYPQGSQNPSRWNAGPRLFTRANRVDDVAFIRDLIAKMVENYCIDTTRIFVNGLSNGGGMTHRLACEMADQIAAVGMVAGAYPVLRADCEPARPIPVIAFHGTSDPLVPYDGNRLMPRFRIGRRNGQPATAATRHPKISLRLATPAAFITSTATTMRM